MPPLIAPNCTGCPFMRLALAEEDRLYGCCRPEPPGQEHGEGCCGILVRRESVIKRIVKHRLHVIVEDVHEVCIGC